MSKLQLPEQEPALPEQQDAVSTATRSRFQPEPAHELGSLARELGRAYDELVTSHQRLWGIEMAAAIEKARTPRERALAMAATDPPDQLTWHTLSAVMEHDPAAGLAAWERVKDAARRELRSGHTTAQSLDHRGTPWDRARFLALREAFLDAWQPRDAIELSLVDLLAQSFSLYLEWSERLSLYTDTECRSEDGKLAREGYRVPPRVSDLTWMRWVSDQADAAHRRFLMSLRALQDLRRLPDVTIASAAQVNIARQQINLAAREPVDP